MKYFKPGGYTTALYEIKDCPVCHEKHLLKVNEMIGSSSKRLDSLRNEGRQQISYAQIDEMVPDDCSVDAEWDMGE